MPIIAQIVSVSTDQMIFLVQSRGSAGEFPIFGGTLTLDWATLQSRGATTNLPSSPVSGQFLQVLYANTNGIGTIPSGAGLTQGQARALYFLDETVDIGNDLVPRALTNFSLRDGLIPWTIDATATGILITAPDTTAGGNMYLRILLRHSFWR